MDDPNRTQMVGAPTLDPHKTIMGAAPSLNTTVTIKPVQCPVCKTFNPPGLMFCNDCGLIFEMALDGDVFGAPSVRLPVLVDSAGKEHQLRPGQNVLGRAGDLTIDDGRVSRRHCQVNVANGQITVEDLGSTNGTTLNGVKVEQGQQAEFHQASKLSLGGFELVLSVPGESSKTIQALSGKTTSLAAAPTVDESVATLILPDREVPLSLGTHSFGRKASNEIVISDPYVSGSHGTFDVQDDGVFLTDTGSTNGTVLNDSKLVANMRTQLGPDDVVRLGSIEVRIRYKS
jgi:pSer/pThr/pTyr-binding forkhead associated (FHA) protein